MKRITTALLATVVGAGLMSSADAADLIIEEPMAEVGIVDVGGNWDGAFIGVYAGAGWGFADHLADPPNNDLDLSGWLVGIDAGFNFTVGSGLVLGVVGDIAWTNISGEEDFGGVFGVTEHSIDWMGSVRGRVGFDGGAFMPYLTAGVAFASGHRSSDSGTNEADATHIGWTVGAGVEFAVTEDVSVDLLYRYTDLGEQLYDYPPGPTDPTIGLTTHTITAGLHWHF